MKNKYTYQLYALTFASDIELPNLKGALQPPVKPPDVVIHSGIIPEHLEQITYCGEWKVMDYTIGTHAGKTATLVHFEQVGQFLIVDGREIRYHYSPTDHFADFHSYLCSIAIVAILYQRKYMVLHASAVVVAGEGLLFFGESGAGKTTTTAGFAQRGYPILTEDVTVVRLIDNVPYILPGIPYLKLESTSTHLLGLDWDTMPELFSVKPKKAYLLTDNYQKQPIPLRHIYHLNKDESASELTFDHEIAYKERFGIIADNIHYKRFFIGYSLDDVYTQMAIFLIEHTPLTRVHRPAQQNTLDVWLDRLEEQFVS